MGRVAGIGKLDSQLGGIGGDTHARSGRREQLHTRRMEDEKEHEEEQRFNTFRKTPQVAGFVLFVCYMFLWSRKVGVGKSMKI